MKNIEYSKMAYLYDSFYKNKDYSSEVNFIKHFILDNTSQILDAGCGTGSHSEILHNLGYKIEGFDISPEMVEIANSKVEDKFFVANLLTFNNEKYYDLIISFFAVFNHLKNYKQFKTALANLKSILQENGTIIIDLHNPQSSGTKSETIDNATRKMTWKKCGLLKKEFTKIKYTINKQIYTTRHIFKIFKQNKLLSIANDLGFKDIDFYENYDITKSASKKSKNIQMVLKY